MISLKYKIRAYKSKSAAMSGTVKSIYSSQTDNFETAKHISKQLAKEYGACVLENFETGNRQWFVNKV